MGGTCWQARSPKTPSAEGESHGLAATHAPQPQPSVSAGIARESFRHENLEYDRHCTAMPRSGNRHATAATPGGSWPDSAVQAQSNPPFLLTSPCWVAQMMASSVAWASTAGSFSLSSRSTVPVGLASGAIAALGSGHEQAGLSWKRPSRGALRPPIRGSQPGHPHDGHPTPSNE